MNRVPYRYEFASSWKSTFVSSDDQAERIVEAAVVADHRAEHHLVVRPLRAAEAAGHPGLEEDRDAFVVPARRGPRGAVR